MEGSRKSDYSIVLMILKPSLWSANLRLKMMWWVPATDSVPSGLRTRLPVPPHVELVVYFEVSRANRVTTPYFALPDAARKRQRRTRSPQVKE